MVTVVEIACVSARIGRDRSYFGHNHQRQAWKLCKNLVRGGWKLAIFVAENKNLTSIVTSGNNAGLRNSYNRQDPTFWELFLTVLKTKLISLCSWRKERKHNDQKNKVGRKLRLDSFQLFVYKIEKWQEINVHFI